MKAGLTLVLLGLLLASCKTMKFYEDEIKGYGYYPYSPVMEFAGTGSIIGGSPKSQSWVANGQVCFPDKVDEFETGLRSIDNSTVPAKTKTFTLSGKAKVDLLKIANMGGATLGAGVEFGVVNTIELTMEGVKVEYLNLPRLAKYYRESLNEDCKEELKGRAIILQAMHADKLTYKFYNKNGAAINLELNNIQAILDIDVRFNYTIEHRTSFIIESPRYIGMHIGLVDNDGRVRYKARKEKKKKWVWEKLDVNFPSGYTGVAKSFEAASSFVPYHADVDLEDLNSNAKKLKNLPK